MDAQHLNVKIYASAAPEELGGAIAVFHRWIQENVCEELAIDVADYRHVPCGPGVILICHQANYSLDWGPENRLGLLYNRKARVDGSTEEKLAQAFAAALKACRRLESEPEFAGKLRFDAGDVAVTVNDRMLAPNTDATWKTWRGEIGKFFGAGHTIERTGTAGERFSARVRAGAI